MNQPIIHPTASVAASVIIGSRTRIWMNTQIRENVVIGENCNIGRNVYVDTGVRLGNNCKIQNNALLFAELTLEDGVFIGPGVILTNDKVPRAVNPDGSLKSAEDWREGTIHIGQGAALGAASVVLTDLSVGAWSMVGAGSVVTHSVPAHALVVGVPARVVGYVCKCGSRLDLQGENGEREWACPKDDLSNRMNADGDLVHLA